MDGKTFDDLARTAANGATRRGALGLLAGAALATGLAKLNMAAAKKGKGKGKSKNKNKKRCKKSFQDCGGKKKCCKGLSCIDGSCGCPTGTIPSEGRCINPDPAECDSNDDCGSGEICQDGQCVPAPPECTVDNDCDDDELCQNGECVPPECENGDDCGANQFCNGGRCDCSFIEVGGECVVPCDDSNDCPGNCNTCIDVFPATGERFVCVDQPFFLCDDAIACDQVAECPPGFICSFVDCGDGDGRCYPVTCVA